MYTKKWNMLKENIVAVAKTCRMLVSLMKGIEHVIHVEKRKNCIVKITLTKFKNGIRTEWKVTVEIFTRSICNYDVKKYNLKQHEQSKTHQYNLKRLHDPEEKDVPKPEETRVMNGNEMYECNTCRSTMLRCKWSKHA